MPISDQVPMGPGAHWLEDHRADTWNDLTHYGSMMSDTIDERIAS